MNPVFLDTAGLVAVVNSDDGWHGVAEPAWQQLVAQRTPLITTSLILIEIGDGFSRLALRPLAVQLYERLHHAPLVEVVPLTPDLEARAWQLYRQRSDKEWAMTDCVSFVVMTERGLDAAFTADHHFEQAGFRVLLTP